MFKQTHRISQFRKCLISALLILFVSGCSQSDPEKNWNGTVDLVSSGVVNIQIDVPIAFDGTWNRSTYATGFVVDAKRGIILTNRHVVTPGPTTAKAILINNEEIDLVPLYIDPVHDFGFFRYQPEQIKHITPHEFKLSNSDPQIGEDIRIIGNDAGQKISILDGTISRLDRDAPKYGKGKYNDFNTFYIQAATASSGGSSGSPVINIRGEAVALNAGSQSNSANAFYLPLHNIKLALEKLQTGQAIERGTLQTTFQSTPYPELKRLGLSDELSTQYRQLYPDLKGLLVARFIIPKSFAAESLAVGDILLEVNQQPTADFVSLESILNENVRQIVDVDVLRQGKPMSFSIQVSDLQELTPASYVKFDGGIFHDLSYQQARHFNKPVQGVYVAKSSNSFKQAGLPHRSVITELNGAEVNSLEEFNTQLMQIADKQKVHLRYFDFSTPNTTNYALVEINRTWFEHTYCHKNADLGYWPCGESLSSIVTAENTVIEGQARVTKNIEDALVSVNFVSPYAIQGRSGNNIKYGTGVIVDINKGWVVVSRNTVYSKAGDVKIIFNNKFELEGKVEYVHPLHNLTLVSYDTTALGNINVAQIDMHKQRLEPGEPVKQVGLNSQGLVEYRETKIDTTEELWLSRFDVPRYIDGNIEASFLVNPNMSIDGVLLNEQQKVVALWLEFEQSDGKEATTALAGFSVDYIQELLMLAESKKPLYSLDINLTQIPPVDALQMGLSNDWLEKIQSHSSDTNKILAVYNTAVNAASSKVLKRGDLILAINDEPVVTFRQLEKLSQQASVNVTYLSQGEVHSAEIKTTPLDGNDIEQIFYWSGLYLHSPHRAAQLQGNVSDSGIYVASYNYGSPATRYGIYAMRRIVEIDGQTIETPDDFINAVKGKENQSSVVIKTLRFNNQPEVSTLKLDNNYWPFFEFNYVDGQWQRIDHSGP